ncbi:MAG: methyltransferase domain-containing protein [Bdellovibrionales bacterium]|jgi:SAM-dependent methyltransferase|nr:methyltransferase domain-containing protein [Bdellovibrionales bacterium]MBT3524846.1 methyltransferase domain-containing protein [Bdellovibrionales bacterium]MBT7668976.1 methyltransferase domain-containing protein [Bdellovibrionales bacterium]MBT7767209.1 methyltransferase domain-containing protein [Bdellovibrionales bacterium]
MSNDQIILKHYRQVAQANGLAATCTMDDPFVRESETKFIEKEIERFIAERPDQLSFKLMDVGCGNGYLLSYLTARFPTLNCVGVEFTPELLELALSRNLEQAEFLAGDCRQPDFINGQFDIVITERVVINLLVHKQQFRALENIASKVLPGGIYLMVESFREPLAELNRARSEMSLELIEQSYQNRYLSEGHIKAMRRFGLDELPVMTPSNYLSSHFYITRVFHKAIRPSGGQVKFSRCSLFFRQALPPAIGNYSPILFRLFRKSKRAQASL